MSFSFENIKTVSIFERQNKVSVDKFADLWNPDESFSRFLNCLPDFLAGSDIKSVVGKYKEAHANKEKIIYCIGAHVIKTGLGPILVDLMKRGMISAVALNGAGAIHDMEIAFCGQTSEDVGRGIKDGLFGMAKETAHFINLATGNSYKEKIGLGFSIGRLICDEKMPYLKSSILYNCYKLGIPATVHLTIGGDITNTHPSADGAAMGDATFRDFKILCSVISKLLNGGMIFNLGSAVVLPVVIEKAINVCRNLGHKVEGFTGVTFDFQKQYRSMLNPVKRAKELGGNGYYIIGHHEIMLPLLRAFMISP